MKDQSDDPSHHEQTLLPRSYIRWYRVQIVRREARVYQKVGIEKGLSSLVESSICFVLSRAVSMQSGSPHCSSASPVSSPAHPDISCRPQRRDNITDRLQLVQHGPRVARSHTDQLPCTGTHTELTATLTPV